MDRKGLKRIKALAALLVLLVMMGAQTLTAFAATARIAFSDPTVTVGDEVSVTMKITTPDGNLGKADLMLAYDSSMLEYVSGTNASGGAGSIKVSTATDTANTKEMSFSLKFKAKQAGNAAIRVSDQEIYDLDGQTVTVSKQGSSAVTISPLASYSKDASLASLQISPGSLTPEFSADVEEYTATVGGGVDKIIVSAPSSDSKARVVISGNDNLQIGENEILCKVTAEDGETVKTYRIKVTKTEGAQPSDQTSGVGTTDGLKVETLAKSVTIVPLEEGAQVPAGLVENSLTISGQKVQGWVAKGEENHQYCVLYAMNADGEKSFYRYDLKERTLQRYFEDAASGIIDDVNNQISDYDQLVHDYNMRFTIILILIGVCVVLFIIILVLLFRRGGRRDFYEDDLEEEEEEEDELFGKRGTREERYLRGLEAEEENGARKDSVAAKGVKRATAAETETGAEETVKTSHARGAVSEAAPVKTAPSKAAVSEAAVSEAAPVKALHSRAAASEAAPVQMSPSKAVTSKAAPVKASPVKAAADDDDDDFEVLDI